MFLSGFLLIASTLAQVISANHKNFKEVVLETDHVVMVEFFAPWCGHCQRLEPEYRKAAGKLSGLVKLVAVDCDNSANKGLCGQYGVQGFPTLKIFGAGKKGSPSDYQGERTADAIVNTLKSAVPATYITKIGGKTKKAMTFDQFKALDNGLAKVILATDKKTTPLLFKSLSLEYLKRLAFAEVKQSEKEYVEALGVTAYPSLYVIPKDSQEVILYDGQIKQDKLIEFFDKYALPSPKPKSQKPKEKEPKKPKKAKEPFNEVIPELVSNELLTEQCINSKSLFCVVTFMPLESEYPESVQVANENKKTIQNVKKRFYDKDLDITFVWVNTIEHGQKLIQDFGVSDFYPSVLAISKTHYGISRYAFDENSIFHFVTAFKAGRGKIAYDRKVQLDREGRTEL